MLLKGIETAKAISAKLQKETEALKQRGVCPCLAIVRVGERQDDLAYERGAMKRCELVGIAVKNVVLAENVSQQELISQVEQLNLDETVHGILVFSPLPKHLDEKELREKLSPQKDVDGITDGSLSGVYSGAKTGFPPCTAEACVKLLKHYEIALEGKSVVVIGRSLVIGKPVSMLLLSENATVTICHSKTKNLEEVCQSADVLVVAAGEAQMRGKDFVKFGQVVVDVGIHVDEDGNLCGDVNFGEVENIVTSISPVPGGVGSVTTAILASHIIEAARRTLA